MAFGSTEDNPLKNRGFVSERPFTGTSVVADADCSPLVSVIITCYNQAHFLSEAIDSVLSQSYPNLEIIVVDDGSTDDTSEVAARFANVRVERQSNQGLSAARNAGIRSSYGEYLVFLDADDRLLPDGIVWGVSCFQSRKTCGMVFGGFRMINADGSIRRNVIRRPLTGGVYEQLLRSNYILMHGTVMYKRSTFDAIGTFDTSLHAAEDYDMYLRIARRFPVACHGGTVAEYRQHGSNMSHDSSLMKEATLAVLASQAEHVASDARLGSAYRRGIETTHKHYTQKLLLQACFELHAPALRRLMEMSVRRPDLVAKSFIEGLDRYTKVSEFARLAAASVRRRLARLGRTDARTSAQSRLKPVSREFGAEFGTPIDRYYIERFLQSSSDAIGGSVLEVGDNSYTRRFGGQRVVCSHVLSVKDSKSGTTIVADLTSAENIASNSYDCIILTQTLHLIYDFHAAAATLHRILKPGGVLLLTVPGITPLSNDEWKETWYWSFTSLSMRRLFDETFGPMVDVEADGNVVAANAFLQGLPTSDLTPEELNFCDPAYQVVICVRARKLPL